MNIYYIDYENVSSQGLKGVELLTENDEVVLLYSKKADNVKIDILTMMMESRAHIRFLPVHVGTPNALDFQLVTLLFLNYRKEDHCYIISKDSGYDCCIKTAAENGAPNVERYPNIESAVTKAPARKTRRGRRSQADSDAIQITLPESAASSAPAPDSAPAQKPAQSGKAVPKQPDGQKETPSAVHSADPDSADSSSPSPEDGTKKKSSRRRGKKKTAPADQEITQSAEQSPAEHVAAGPSESGKNSEADQTPEPARDQDSVRKQDSPKNQELSKKRDSSKNLASDRESDPEKQPEKVQEVILQQRYLSKQFEPRNPQGASSGSRTDAEKPVSILSVIRRRNDVQLDMHQIDLIREALRSSNNKQQFYSYFVKKLGQKQGIELYHSVKSSYTDLVNANVY